MHDPCDRRVGPLVARRARLDLFHAPSYTAPVAGPRPLILTILALCGLGLLNLYSATRGVRHHAKFEAQVQWMVVGAIAFTRLTLRELPNIDPPIVSKFDNDSAPVITLSLSGDRTPRGPRIPAAGREPGQQHRPVAARSPRPDGWDRFRAGRWGRRTYSYGGWNVCCNDPRCAVYSLGAYCAVPPRRVGGGSRAGHACPHGVVGPTGLSRSAAR